MKILSINVTEFGKLRDLEIKLSDGMNIIEGSNESGKSTLLLFVVYMLYGLPRSSRKGAPDAFDKQRSLSWENKRAEGSMTLLHGGRRLRIERENTKRSASSAARVFDLDTGERLELSGEVGEELLGIGRESFESSLWCGQTRSGAIKAEDLSNTLSNLSLTADESVDGEAALSALRNARKQYRHERGNGGVIFELDEEIARERERKARVDRELAESYADRERLIELEGELQLAEKRFSEIKTLKDSMTTVALLSGFRRLDEDEKKLRDAESELEALRAENGYSKIEPDGNILARLRMLIAAREEKRVEYHEISRQQPEPPRVDSEAVEAAMRISEKYDLGGALEAVEKRILSFKTARAAAIPFFALGALSAAGAALGLLGVRLPFLALTAVFGLIGVLLLIRSSKLKNSLSADLSKIGAGIDDYRVRIDHCFTQKRVLTAEKEAAEAFLRQRRDNALRELERIGEQIRELVTAYGRDSESEEELIRRIERFIKKKEDVKRRIMLVSSFVERDRKQLEGQDRKKLEASLPKNIGYKANISGASLETEYAEASSALEDLRNRLTETKIKLSGYRATEDNSLDIKRGIDDLCAKRAEAVYRYQVLTKALEATDAAYSNMRRNFAPKIRENASDKLEKISGGKYSRLFMSEDFGISIDVLGSERELGNFSTGACDAAYLALRLALTENIFSEPMPVFLDESLSNLDDRRAACALALLGEYVKNGGQCILLTCHPREAEIARSLSLDTREINL